MSNDFDNTGKVSLWPVDSENTKAPQFKGKFYAHRAYMAGEEISLSLWSNQNANPNGPSYNAKAPRYTGKVEDKFVPNSALQSPMQTNAPYEPPQAAPTRGTAPNPNPLPSVPNDELDDSIPF